MTHRLTEKYIAANWPTQDGNVIDHLTAIEERVKSVFTYAAEAKDKWRTSAEKVLNGEKFSDDCDGLAYTCLDLASAAGVDPHRLIRMIVASPNSKDGKSDHMIGGYEDDKGNIWVLGDTFGPPRTLDSSGHKLNKYARIDTRKWFKQQ